MSINIRNINKSFGDNAVLDNISLEIKNNGIYAIVGRSGSGKSTLINLISGLDTPTSGEIILEGESDVASKEQLQQEVSVIYQEYYLMNGISVYDNIEIAMQLSGNGSVEKTSILEVLEHLNLADLADRKVEKLSGGEKQRVAIARAYLANRNIIVADEPTGNLDDENATIVFELLKKVAKDKIVIVVSHDRLFVERYADEIYEIQKGKFIVKRERIAETTTISTNIVDDDRESASKLTAKSRLRLLKHVAQKKKILTPCICFFSMIIMTLMCVLSSISMVTFGSIVLNNIDDNTTSLGIVCNDRYQGYQQTNVYADLLDDIDIAYSKGLIFRDIDERVELDYSDKSQSLYYYLNGESNFKNMVELSSDVGVKLSVGVLPRSATEVIIPQYFAQQLIFTETEFDGIVIKNEQDIVGRSLLLGDTAYTITGVYLSDTYYASRLGEFTIADMEKENESEEISEIIRCASSAPSLTTLFFGEGFIDGFIRVNDGDLSEILVLPDVDIEEIDWQNIFTVLAVDFKDLTTAEISQINDSFELILVSDTSAITYDIIDLMDTVRLIILAVIILMIIFDMSLGVLMINLQYRDMRKDIGIMMSFGAKLSTISGLFLIVYTIIFVVQMIIALALSAIIMPMINGILGISGLAIFTWSAMSIVAVSAVSLLSVGASLLVIILVLKRKNLIESLRDE